MTLASLPFVLDRPLLAAALLAVITLGFVALARRSRADAGVARRRGAFALRIAVAALLVLALCGLQWSRPRDVLATVFAVDSSDSTRGAPIERARAFVLEAATHAKATDQLAVVQFGRDALVEEGLTADLPELALASRPHPDGSNLASALRLARGLMPPDGRRRVVVLTDGAVDGDDPTGAIRDARAEGVDVVLVPVAGERGPEALVDEIIAPARVHESEPFEVRVILRASARTKGNLTITRDGKLLGVEPLTVEAGQPTAFRFVERNASSGTHAYRAHFDGEPDGFAQNDAAEALVRVEGQPSVLVIDPEPARVAGFVSLLEGAGMRVEARGAGGVPATLAEAAAWSAIVFSDVDSIHLSTPQVQSLGAYVREVGGGFLMTGGERSFGLGGWYATAVEAALPVDMDVRNEKYYPSLSLACVIDKSGSMSGDVGVSKIDLAKEAAILAVELLHPGDRAGIVAFDSAGKWVVPMTDALEKASIAQRIGTIRSGGCTDIYAGLVLAHEGLAPQATVLKHAIVLSDGQSPPRDFEARVGEMRRDGITVSTVAVGSDADLYTMELLARWGHGRYYFTEDPQSIPRIFTKEAFTVGRSFLVEEAFTARAAQPHAVLAGVDVASLPALRGYVATTAKPAGEVLLTTHREDPLLAVHRFGLGRAGAFTSDLGQRWAGTWLAAPSGRKTMAQLLRWLGSRSESPNLRVQLERSAGELDVSVEGRDEAGRYLNFASLEATVVGPDLLGRKVTLRQVAPGRYEGTAAAEEPGAFFVGVVQREGDRIVRSTGVGTAFSYSDEYRTLSSGDDAVERLALASGARIVTDPAAAFVHDGPPTVALRPAWRELLLAAALLFLVDVALRRVMLPDGWAAALSRRMPRFARRHPAVQDVPVGLARLRGAKQRTQEQARAGLGPPPEAGARVDAAATGVAPPVAGEVTPRERPAAPPPSREPEPAPRADEAAAGEAGADASFRERLLAAKKRARGENPSGL